MRRKIILLVEDNARDEALTRRALEKSHLLNEIVTVRDGVEALDFLMKTGPHEGEDIHDLPELVLLDLKLPKINGLQVLEKLRTNEATRRLPVVVFTSSSEEEDMFRSYDLGANSYVRKPVDFVQFQEATTQLGMYWLMLNQTPAE
jgi:CheY-like chemotaxis protein